MKKHAVFRLPTQAQYPKKIYFSNEVYTIKFVKKLDCYGETDASKKTITIKDGLAPRALLCTVLHELLHVVEFEFPLKIKHKDVYDLEKALSELLIDNFFCE